jgi:hypothetical protein
VRRTSAVIATLLIALAPDARAQSVPAVSLGNPTATFEEPFDQVTAVRELSDGRVLVADLLARAVSLADLERGTVSAVGREGQGPKEFNFPMGLVALPGDSTLLIDPGQRRFLMIGPDGAPITTIPFPEEFSGPVRIRGADRQGRVYAEGSAISFGPETAELGEQSLPDSVPLLLWDRASGRVDRLGKIKIPEMTMAVSGGRNARAVAMRQAPLPAADAWSVTPEGRIGIARVGDYHVDWWGAPRATGRPVRYTPVKVSDRDKEIFQERTRDPRSAFRISEGGSPRSSGGARPIQPPDLPEPEWPEFKPPFVVNSALATPTGQLWVERSQPAESDRLYDIFGPDGNLMRQVKLSADRRIIGFGSGTVYVARSDDDELQYLERYRLP